MTNLDQALDHLRAALEEHRCSGISAMREPIHVAIEAATKAKAFETHADQVRTGVFDDTPTPRPAT